MPVFSIIIPIYNVEKYLEKCVNSVLQQDFRDFEVILVDDGSPDNCPQICDNFAQKDNRIKVIHKKNGGLSDARNVGIANATGDYILFLDSDDYWEGDYHLTEFDSIITTNKDVEAILFNCKHLYEDTQHIYEKKRDKIPNLVQQDENILVKLIKTENQSSSACLRAVKRKLIVEKEVYFKKNLFGEDSDWFIHQSIYINNYYFYHIPFYIYRQNRKDSITNKMSMKNFKDQLYIIDYWSSNIDKFQIPNDKIIALKGFLAYLFSILVLNMDKLPKNHFDKMNEELENRASILKYSINTKSNVIYYLYKLFGIKYTSFLIKTLYSLIIKIRKNS